MLINIKTILLWKIKKYICLKLKHFPTVVAARACCTIKYIYKVQSIYFEYIIFSLILKDAYIIYFPDNRTSEMRHFSLDITSRQFFFF